MKWGHLDEVEESEKLLYWVLMYVLAPYFDDPIDHWLKDILLNPRGLGGDPGWEMKFISEGKGSYCVWADPEVSGIEPSEVIFDSDVVLLNAAALRQYLIFGRCKSTLFSDPRTLNLLKPRAD